MKKWLLIPALLFASACFGQITMERNDDGILIKEGSSHVFFYQLSPKSVNGEYRRNNYIHPLWGLDGKILTEDFPEDHLHQRGIFWAWHQVWIDGNRIADGWELNNYEQEVQELEFIVNRQKQGVLKSEIFWDSPVWKNGEPYLKENNIITVYPRKGKVRRIDFEISLLALTKGLKLGGSEDEKGYGGFSIRAVLPDNVTFSGKEGQIKPETNAVEAGPFIHISGALAKNGRIAGIVIISHPDNPAYPNAWILREKESMQNAVWPGREAVPISTENPVVLKYTLLVYKGRLRNKNIEKIFDSF